MTQVKKLDSVEQGVISKSYKELIEMYIHLDHQGYDATAKELLKLIKEKRKAYQRKRDSLLELNKKSPSH